MNLEEKIQYVAKQRYTNVNLYWAQQFINSLKNNGYRDIWVSGGMAGQIAVNVYDQYAIHEDNLYYRQTATTESRLKLKHDVQGARKKWQKI